MGKSSILADEMDLYETEARCTKCRLPLHERIDSELRFCWGCTINTETVKRAKVLLERIKLIDSSQEHTKKDWYSPFSFGAPL